MKSNIHFDFFLTGFDDRSWIKAMRYKKLLKSKNVYQDLFRLKTSTAYL